MRPHPAPLRLLLVCAFMALLPGCRSGAFPHYAANYREYAYVANSGSNTISVLDLVNVRQQALLAVGPHPVALASNPASDEVYAVSQGAPDSNGSLAIINAETNRLAATLPLGRNPVAIAIDSVGQQLYAANAGANSISVINLPTRHQTAVAGVGERPGALAVTPDNSTLVVANRQSGSVSILGLRATGAPVLRASFAGCPGAGSIAVLPDSSKAFVACSGGHQVMALGLRSEADAHPHDNPLAAGGADRLLAMLDVGTTPMQLMLKPDGGELFVANQDADTISEILTSTNEVGGATIIGARPSSGVVSADNSLLWVANQGADTVGVYSIDDGKLIHTVAVGSGPGAMAFSADGHLLLAANTGSGDVSLLRTFSRNFHHEAVYGTLFTLLPAGSRPSAIVVKAFKLGR